jgi:hypothetical protein
MNVLLKDAIRKYGNGVAPIRRSSNLSTKPTKPVVNRGGSHTIPHLVKELIKSHISALGRTPPH